jgi:hypothetical protein
MKNYTNRIRQIILSLLLISLNIAADAQLPVANVDTFAVKNYQEKLFIRTDRDIYITGEEILLKIYKMSALTGKSSDMSKVVYLELLDSLNNPVTQIKIPVIGTSGSTSFRISDTLNSGNYLIRAYTRWMLNYSEDLFFYKTITVINPFKNIDNLPVSAGSRPGETNMFFNEANQVERTSVTNEKVNHINIKVEPDKNEYLTRDKVRLNISASSLTGDMTGVDMSVSVVKSFLLNKGKLNIINGFETDAGTNPFQTDSIRKVNDSQTVSYLNDRTARNRVRLSMGLLPSYMPEIEGQLISGVIKNKTTDVPVKNTDISLSFVGKTAKCQFVKTNDKGEFYFVVKDQYGMSEFVIQSMLPEITDYYVEVNLPFCNTFNSTKPGVFSLDSNKIASINKAIISMQINNIYEQARREKQSGQNFTGRGDFYGKADKSVKLSDFIELTNIREIVKEILPDLMVIKRNRKNSFKIVNSYPFQPFENQALILVDGVPVFDIEGLLNVPAKSMERVDIINTRYFFSDNVFDGIVSFVTKKGDLSVLEYDNSVYRQIFDGYKQKNDFYSPDYSSDHLKESRIPDFRNTLYWNPDLKFTPGNNTSVEFFTSDEAGIYTIIVEGRTEKGETGFYSTQLLVR